MTGASESDLVSTCFKPKIETVDGVLIDVPHISIDMPSAANQPAYINFTSQKVMVEPAVKFTVAMTCGISTQRVYPLLMDFAGAPNAVSITVLPAASSDSQSQQGGRTTADQPAATAPAKRRRFNQNVAAPALIKLLPVQQPAVEQAATPNPAAIKSGAKRTTKRGPTGRDVLQVATEDSTSDFDLKMSQTLTETAAPDQDQQRIAENKIAQAQFSALMRGEDPLLAAQNEIKRQELKSQTLQAELEKIKLQDAQREQNDQHFSPLAMALVATVSALCLALGGLIAFAILRARRSKENTWWDATAEQKKKVVEMVDYLQTTAESGNLDPNPITTTRDVSSKEPAFDPAVDPSTSIGKEVQPVKFTTGGLPALEDTNSSTFNFFGNRGQSIHIEEISDITQEAEFWMSVNDPHRAIEILEPQSLDENPATPITWLYLLDLYRLVADEDKYTDLRTRFKLKFNAKIPNFQEELVPGTVRNFEDFAHLTANCCALWQTDDIMGYLESLLVDNREGERVGFDLPVYRDILFLLSICAELKRTRLHAIAKNDRFTRAASKNQVAPSDILVVKSEAPEPNDYSNSLNFDLLDFKPDHKEGS